MQRKVFADIQHQVWATFVVNVLVFGLGSAIGWYSPSLPILKSDDRSPLANGRPIDDIEAGWIGASMPCGSIIGTISFGLLSNAIGMKKSLLLAALPITTSWLVIWCAQHAWHLYVARIFAGLTSGAVFVCVPLFNAEIASDHVRGQLNSYLQVSCYSGMTFSYVLGSFFEYHTVPLVLSLFPVVFLMLFVGLHDTPQQLLKQGQEEKAEQSLRFYRNCQKPSIEQEMMFQIKFEKLKTIAKQNQLSSSVKISDFLVPQVRNNIIIGSTLICMSHLCGTYVLMNYAATIFAHTGSSLDASTSTIIMGGMLIVGVYSASMAIDRIGRKVLMLISSGGASVGLLGTGIYALFAYKGYDMAALNMVPVICLSFYIFISAIGMLPVPYVYATEIFPQRLRRIGCTVCTTSISVCAVFQLKMFPLILGRIGLHSCMFMFASVGVLGMVFTLFAMKETKGVNLDVIAAAEAIDTKSKRDPGPPE